MRPESHHPVNRAPAARGVFQFIATHWRFVAALSLLVLIPSFWHRHIEAGDLGSHLYNAWLAQLIGQGSAPGLLLVRQWDNVLCDFALLYAAKAFGFLAAERIVVGLCVLAFFWGVFAFIATVAGRAPWSLTPAIAMLAYGYAFNMGFLNYYLSLALACIGLGLAWSSPTKNWLLFLLVAVLTFLAHPIGFLWLLAMLLYRAMRHLLPGLWKLCVPVATLFAFYGLHWYLLYKIEFAVDWTAMAWYWRTGADQLAVYGPRYKFLSLALVGFCAVCVALDWFLRIDRKRLALHEVAPTDVLCQGQTIPRDGAFSKFSLTVEWYVLAIAVTGLLPENLRPDPAAGWIGLLASRLTVITAIFGLALLGCVRPRKWQVAGFGATAAVFFVFLYQDTGWISGMEANAERLVSQISFGTRIIPNVDAPADWRIPFIVHSADRACIGHCFIYSNYEPASRQFRIRVGPQGSPLAVASTDDAESMQSGEYLIQPSDPPLLLLYQCDDHDLRRLCLHRLRPGQKTEDPGQLDAIH